MSKQAYTSDRHRSKGEGTLGRAEHLGDEDRPFAEIRKNLNDALRMLSLHRWAFFVPFAVVTCAAFILSLYYPRTYRATTSFERRNDPVMMNLPLSAGAASFKYFRNTMVRDLTSVECMTEVVENLDLTKHFERGEDGALTQASLRRRNALARSLASKLSIITRSPSEHIDIIAITYTGPDPTIGRKLIDEVKRTYIRRTMVWIHDFLTDQRDYFKREAAEALEDVKQAQREETRLRLEHPHVDPANPGALSLKLAQLELERRELLMRQREYKAELSAMRQMVAAVEPQLLVEPGIPNQGDSLVQDDFSSPQALHLIDKIRTLEQEIETLRATRGMTDQHPEIQKLLASRQRLDSDLDRQRLQDRNLTVPNAPLDTAVAQLTLGAMAARPWESERSRLRVQIAAQKSKLKDVEISLEANRVATDQIQIAKQGIYQQQEEFAAVAGMVGKAKKMLGQLEQTLAMIEPAITAIEQGRLLQFSEGQPARGGSLPVSPKAATIVLLALLAGVATGAVFVVLAEVLDHVFHSSGQVARSLGLPMLESIDEIITAQDRRYLFLRNVVMTPLFVTCLLVLTGLSGSMAYLSIEQPWTYQKIRKIPQAAIQLFAGDSDADDDVPGSHHTHG